MVHFTNQHDPAPDTSPKGVYLTQDQFSKLVELLTPGYNLALHYLAAAGKQTPAPPAPDVDGPSSEPSSFDP